LRHLFVAVELVAVGAVATGHCAQVTGVALYRGLVAHAGTSLVSQVL
jgi:stage V sporulation protein SpoVS